MAQPIDLTIAVNGMCSTCKHWIPHFNANGWGDCMIVHKPKEESPKIILVTPYGEGKRKRAKGWVMFTNEDFGCNQ